MQAPLTTTLLSGRLNVSNMNRVRLPLAACLRTGCMGPGEKQCKQQGNNWDNPGQHPVVWPGWDERKWVRTCLFLDTRKEANRDKETQRREDA